MEDLRVEAFLNRGGWEWEYAKAVAHNRIDIKYSTDNPARLGRKLDDERVQRYGLQMEEGIEFPAIVLLSPSDKGVLEYDIAGGVHRTHARELAHRDPKVPVSGDAYIVREADRYRRETLIRRLNTLEGEGVSTREQIGHIIHLHLTFPTISISSLCKEWNIKVDSVRMHLKAHHGRERAREAGFDLDRAKVPLRLMGEMHSSIHSKRVYDDMCAFVVHHSPRADIIEEVCRKVKSTRDEAAQQKEVQKAVDEQVERKRRESAKTARVKTGPAQTMIYNAVRFIRQVQAKGIDQLFLSSLTDSDTVKGVATLEDMMSWAKKIMAEFERIQQIKRSGHGLAAE